MGYVEKHHGKYRARYRDVSGRTRSKSFTLRADAERWVREEEVALERGAWIDPRAAEMTLAEWCERFMSSGAAHNPVANNPPSVGVSNCMIVVCRAPRSGPRVS